MIGKKRKLEESIQIEECIKDNKPEESIMDELMEKRFNSIPKFKYIKDISKIIDHSGFNDIFDTYNLNDPENTGYIAFKNKDGHLIIYRIKQTRV